MTNGIPERVRYANVEIIEKGNMAVVEEVFLKSYVVHTGDGAARGHRFIKTFITQLRTAFPDIRVVDVDPLLVAEDRIAWRRTLSGTHEKDLMGFPPTGRKVEWHDMLVSRFEGQQIAEEWAISDLAGQLLLGRS